MRRLRRSLKGQALYNDGLLKAGAFSLLIHVALAVLLTFSGRPSMTEMPSIYRVTIRPFAPRGDGGPLGSPVPGSRGSPAPAPEAAEKPKSPERPKSVEKPSKVESTKERVVHTTKKQKLEEHAADRTTEGLKRNLKKEDVDKQKSNKRLQEALEEINKKAALDRIQKKVALRPKSERGTTEESGMPRSQESVTSSSGTGTGSGSGTGTGTGSGSAGSPTGGSPWGSLSGGSSAFESKLNDYYNMVWAKIKKEWTLPGEVPKGGKNLETIIVIEWDRNGKIQKSYFEKKSGNSQYDQSAMRAIKKAEPLPAIPREFSDETLELGFRFYPE
ncbi:MAG: TonB family protein [Thermodesulfobacteriota bacterium]